MITTRVYLQTWTETAVLEEEIPLKIQTNPTDPLLTFQPGLYLGLPPVST